MLAKLAVGLIVTTAVASAQTLEFYEGNGARQDLVCRVDISDGGYLRINFKKHRSCDNDEARSMVLLNVPRGRIIRLFDSPGRKTNDDWVEIRTLRDIDRFVVGTFEEDVSDGTSPVRVDYRRKNGLDGKVSSLVAGPPLTDPCDDRAVEIRQDGGLIIAEGGVGCGRDFRLELRIKEDVSGWFDKTLRKATGTGNEISTSYTCRRGGEGTLFAELKVNGKKTYSRRISGASCQPSP